MGSYRTPLLAYLHGTDRCAGMTDFLFLADGARPRLGLGFLIFALGIGIFIEDEDDYGPIEMA